MQGGRHTNRRAKPKGIRKGKEIQTPAPRLLVLRYSGSQTPPSGSQEGELGQRRAHHFLLPQAFTPLRGRHQRAEKVAFSWKAPFHWSPSGSWADLSSRSPVLEPHFLPVPPSCSSMPLHPTSAG